MYSDVGTLRTILLEQAALAVGERKHVPRQCIVEWIENARTLSSKAIGDETLAAEASLPRRSEFDAIARCLTLLVIRDLGCDESVIAGLGGHQPLARFSASITKEDGGSELWAMLDGLKRFYTAISDWLVAGYEMRRLSDCLAALGDEERIAFARSRDSLSHSIQRYADDPLLPDDLELWDGEIPRIISDLQVMRRLAQAGRFVSKPSGSNTKSSADHPADTCLAIFVPTFPSSRDGDETLAAVLFENDRVHFWAGESRSRLWYRAARLIAAQDATSIFDDIDVLVEECAPAAGLCLDALTNRIKTVRVVDLSSKNVPVSLLEDDGDRFSFTIGISAKRPVAKNLRPCISYWGLISENGPATVSLDEASRSIDCQTVSGRVLIQHPAIPDPDRMRFEHRPAPLVLGHYERWDFEDHATAGRCSLDLHIDDKASRTAFLQCDWENVDVLHVSAHARAFASAPEFAHIRLSELPGQPGALHSFDILSQDLSNLGLVFLSACQTKLGSQWTGNEDLSLAWAFRAAGAGAVIAMRWEVSEAAAWLFSHHFYNAWLGKPGVTVPQAFRLAQKAVREHKHFRKANLWGPFVLLD